MEYIIHYSNGDDAFLAHHGVKGMHWGVRNEETLAKYNGNRGLARMRSKLDKQAQRLQGAAYREHNNPYTKRYRKATRAQAEKLTNMQVKYHSKVAKILGDDASDVDKTASHVKKANRNIALATGAGVAAAGVLGGVAAYNIAKNTKENKKALRKQEEIVQRNLKMAREEAKRGSEETRRILEGQRSGELNVHAMVPDGHGGTYIVTSKNTQKKEPSEQQIDRAAVAISEFKQKQASGQRMTLSDYRRLTKELKEIQRVEEDDRRR